MPDINIKLIVIISFFTLKRSINSTLPHFNFFSKFDSFPFSEACLLQIYVTFLHHFSDYVTYSTKSWHPDYFTSPTERLITPT